MNCPQCGSPGSFKLRRRISGDWLQIVIKCTVCTYIEIVRQGPKELVELEMDVDRLHGRVEAGETQLGSVLRAREARLERVRLDLGGSAG